MRNAIRISSKPIWFSRWSRHAYAAFVSMGKVVHIGRVKVDICRMALLKSNALGNDALALRYSVSTDSDDDYGDSGVADAVLQQLMRELAMPVSQTIVSAGASYFLEIYFTKECIARFVCLSSGKGAGFLFVQTPIKLTENECSRC